MTTVNIYAPNVRAPKYVKNRAKRRNKQQYKTTVGDFNTPTSTIVRSENQQGNSEFQQHYRAN